MIMYDKLVFALNSSVMKHLEFLYFNSKETIGCRLVFNVRKYVIGCVDWNDDSFKTVLNDTYPKVLKLLDYIMGISIRTDEGSLARIIVAYDPIDDENIMVEISLFTEKMFRAKHDKE